MAYEQLSVEDLARKFGGQVDGDDIEQLARKFGGKIEDRSDFTPLQAGGAVASGFNRGVIAGLGGLPAKVGADLIDLGKAAYGYAGGKLGILGPNDLPEMLDRSKVIGSPEWITEKMQGNPVSAAFVNNPRPDLATARLLNAGGHAVGSSMAARPADAAMQFASGMSGQLAAEAGAPPEWAMLASMGPQAATMAAAGGTRGVMRGGDEGRRAMEQRTAELRAAGVEPSVGLATGRRFPQAIESTLSRTPGAAGAMAAKAEQMRDALGQTVNASRDRVSSDYGPIAAGEALKHGAEGYRTQQQQIMGELMDRALSKVPNGMQFPVNGMIARGEAALSDVPGAPNVSRVLNQPRGFTQEVVGALGRDAAPQPPQQVPSRILQESGQPFTTQTPGTPGGIGIEGIRGLRSRIGELAYANNPLNADANTGSLKSLYAGAKSDLMNAGALADAERVNRGQQPGVLPGLQRADRFYSVTSKVLDEVLAPLHKVAETSPERAYGRVEAMAKDSGANVQRLMASVPLDARRTISATVIDRLGRAAPGQQSAEGDRFSPATFLTNWNKLTPAAKTGLFLGIPNASAVRDKLEHVAKAAERLNDAGRVYANPSGTAGAAAVLGSVASAGGGLALMGAGHTSAGLSALGAVLGTAAAARGGAALMTNPKFVTWLSQSTAIKPERISQHLNRLGLVATQEKDPQHRAMLEDFTQDLRQELGY